MWAGQDSREISDANPRERAVGLRHWGFMTWLHFEILLRDAMRTTHSSVLSAMLRSRGSTHSAVLAQIYT